MGMELRLVPGMGQHQETRLSQSQRLKLEALLKLELDLRGPEIPEARRGLEGMKAADSLLKERGGVGLLIGGVSEEIWKKGANAETISSHKDVDVLVLSDSFKVDDFEAGIDWWLPHKQKFEETTYSSQGFGYMSNIEVEWFENGNGIVLNYFVDPDAYRPKHIPDPKAGLYIPSPDLVAGIKAVELYAIAEGRNMEIDIDDSEMRIKRKIRRKMIRTLEPEVKLEFGKKVTKGQYFELYLMDPDKRRTVLNRER